MYFAVSLRPPFVDMLWRRILYLIACIGCFAFFVAYGEWLSYLLLLFVLGLPWLSLLLSLPAMLTLKAKLICPSSLWMGDKLSVQMELSCPLPVPPVHWRFEAHELYSGKKLKMTGTSPLLADHCGCIEIRMKRAWKYDYLGLFRLPVGKRQTYRVLVQPKPVPVTDLPSLKRYIAGSWRPKVGGGFAENYDLRSYRLGDDLRQIHWKLAAKSGKLIVREPMIPVRGTLALTMLLRGSAEQLDEKMGKLRYLSDYLLKKELPHELHCLTGEGMVILPISDAASMQAAVDRLLCAPVTAETKMSSVRASWQYQIGGALDET